MKINIEEAVATQSIRAFAQFSTPFHTSAKDYVRLRDNIRKIGQQEPVVMWANVLIDGYQRLKALQEIGERFILIERMQFKTAQEALEWKINNHKHRLNGTLENK